MTALDFPDAPTNGDLFTAPGGIVWEFQDPLWVLAGGGASGGSDGYTFVQDATPTATADGQTWWQSTTGYSFLWFDSQWVMTAPGDAAPPPAVTASLWLTTVMDLTLPAAPAAPSVTTTTILFGGSEISDPTAFTYDPATGIITLLRAGRYLVTYHFQQAVNSADFVLGASGHECSMDVRSAASHSTGEWSLATVRMQVPMVAPFSFSNSASGQFVRKFVANSILYARIAYGCSDLIGRPTDAASTGKTQLRTTQQSGGGNRATGMDIVWLGP